MKIGGIVPKPGEVLNLLLSDGTYANCTREDLADTGLACPKGWYGDATDNFCFKVQKQLVDNKEAVR